MSQSFWTTYQPRSARTHLPLLRAIPVYFLVICNLWRTKESFGNGGLKHWTRGCLVAITIEFQGRFVPWFLVVWHYSVGWKWLFSHLRWATYLELLGLLCCWHNLCRHFWSHSWISALSSPFTLFWLVLSTSVSLTNTQAPLQVNVGSAFHTNIHIFLFILNYFTSS